MGLSRSFEGVLLSVGAVLGWLAGGPAQAAVAPTVVPIEKGGVIVGTVEGEKPCLQGKPHAWLSIEQTLLYHVDVAMHGNFEFHALPGRMNLVVITSNGCFVEKIVDLKAGEVQEVTLLLKKVKKAEQK